MSHERESTSETGAIAVTGSKGGVGKSHLAANVGVALARRGRRVVLVDGDLGLANLDVLLGVTPERTVEDLVGGSASVADLLVEGPAGVRLLPAASGVPALARLDEVRRRRLLAALAEAGRTSDHLLIDTGAGLGPTALALLLGSARIVLVTTVEPTSLVDAYATLKVVLKADPSKPVDIVVNAHDGNDEVERAYRQIVLATERFLGRTPGLLGAVPRDERVPEAVRRQRPVVELYPESPAARAYEAIAMRLVSPPEAGVTVEARWGSSGAASPKEVVH